jgi:hypothetical protein
MMKKLRIGVVDLDTSHPGSWVPVIKELGHEVVGVFDGGTVYEEGYAVQFAQKHNIPKVYDTLEDMAQDVDAAIIHSVNWNLHIERARPFVEAGKALLIDKPMIGSYRDAEQLVEWERNGIRLIGGSSLSVCEEVKEWHLQHDRNDPIVTVFAGCSVDEFNYGVHAFSLLQAIMGSGIDHVRSIGTHIQHQIEITWKDGRKGLLSVGTTQGYLPFYATVVTENTVKHIQVDNSRLYRSLLEAYLPYLAGEVTSVMPLSSLLEVELSALAARASMLSGGQCISLSQIDNNDAGYDGKMFAEQYRKKVRGL